jgi:hypothetical protein
MLSGFLVSGLSCLSQSDLGNALSLARANMILVVTVIFEKPARKILSKRMRVKVTVQSIYFEPVLLSVNVKSKMLTTDCSTIPESAY